MKRKNLVQIGLTLISTMAVCSLLGCVATERSSTQEVTKTGKNWVENTTRQTTKDKHGKIRVEKQSFYEKVRCIGSKGEEISVQSPEECIDIGGKVIDEVVIEESTRKMK